MRKISRIVSRCQKKKLGNWSFLRFRFAEDRKEIHRDFYCQCIAIVLLINHLFGNVTVVAGTTLLWL